MFQVEKGDKKMRNIKSKIKSENVVISTSKALFIKNMLMRIRENMDGRDQEGSKI